MKLLDDIRHANIKPFLLRTSLGFCKAVQYFSKNISSEEIKIKKDYSTNCQIFIQIY